MSVAMAVKNATVTNAHMPNCARVTLKMHVLAVSACMRGGSLSVIDQVWPACCVVLLVLCDVEDRMLSGCEEKR